PTTRSRLARLDLPAGPVAPVWELPGLAVTLAVTAERVYVPDPAGRAVWAVGRRTGRPAPTVPVGGGPLGLAPGAPAGPPAGAGRPLRYQAARAASGTGRRTVVAPPRSRASPAAVAASRRRRRLQAQPGPAPSPRRRTVGLTLAAQPAPLDAAAAAPPS